MSSTPNALPNSPFRVALVFTITENLIGKIFSNKIPRTIFFSKWRRRYKCLFTQLQVCILRTWSMVLKILRVFVLKMISFEKLGQGFLERENSIHFHSVLKIAARSDKIMRTFFIFTRSVKQFSTGYFLITHTVLKKNRPCHDRIFS